MLGNENVQRGQIMRAVSEWLASELFRIQESGVLLLEDNFLSLFLSRWLTTLVDGFLGEVHSKLTSYYSLLSWANVA